MGKTEYILSLSYGKDSLACLEAIRLLGYPLDRIITAEVWATDTIPADLPPMVEFKKKADRIIKERYGITVEHTSAMRKRARLSYESIFYSNSPRVRMSDESTVSQCNEDNGVRQTSKQKSSPELQKVTFENLFYHVPQRKKSTKAQYEGKITGFPCLLRPWCNSNLKVKALSQLAFL